jgi:hypothetical protein
MVKIEVVGKPCRQKTTEEEEVSVGQWYWMKVEEQELVGKKTVTETREYLSCVVGVGSNYVELNPVTRSSVRVHFDEFWERCRLEPDPDPVIAKRITDAQQRAMHLMAKVHEVTARLSIGSELSLSDGSEGKALARLDSSVSAKEHKEALIRAKKETLPELFRKIEEANKRASTWMRARIIPMTAQAEGMKGVIESIEGRIFNVELYAGLTEKVELVREGEPGGISEKVHMMQRMHYMDEECLANYKAGGIEFSDIRQFDKWLSEKDNFRRLFPAEKCIVAFRVRREVKERHAASLSDFIRIYYEQQGDKATFLYIRNGDRLYRMSTDIEFGAKLFPDMVEDPNKEMRWAKKWAEYVLAKDEELITQGAYDEMKAEYEKREADRLRRYREAPKKERWHHQWPERDQTTEYVPFSQKSVMYDDILKRERSKEEKHNRIVLILQGLLDRSEVLHPHPAWRIWEPGGFQQALELVRDDSRALVPGPKPDFEAYRARLNGTIVVGTLTIGQDRAWALHEGDKYRRKVERDFRRSTNVEFLPREHRPHGNPGPGHIARVAKATRSSCTFRWTREREDWRSHKKGRLPCSIVVPKSELLNVDAYTPGDFRQFYDDPRTRAEYMRWAPLLLGCEEYKAGNRRVGPEE